MKPRVEIGEGWEVGSVGLRISTSDARGRKRDLKAVCVSPLCMGMFLLVEALGLAVYLQRGENKNLQARHGRNSPHSLCHMAKFGQRLSAFQTAFWMIIAAMHAVLIDIPTTMKRKRDGAR